MRKKYSFPEDRYILIGNVTKAQGLHGEVVIRPISGQPENFETYTILVLVDESGELSPDLNVTKLRIHKGKVFVLFDRVKDRSFAEKLVGMGVLLAREHLPPPADGEFYWHEITGLPVITDTGEEIGQVTSLFSNGAQDIMVVTGNDREYLIPMTDEVVVEQNEKEIIIQPLPGLLEINQAEE